MGQVFPHPVVAAYDLSDFGKTNTHFFKILSYKHKIKTIAEAVVLTTFSTNIPLPPKNPIADKIVRYFDRRLEKIRARR